MKNIHSLYLLLILITAAMPAFEGVDKMAFQWLYLNIVNLLYVLVLIIQNDYKTLVTNKSLNSFAAFVVMAVICGFFALNKTESVIEIRPEYITFISCV